MGRQTVWKLFCLCALFTAFRDIKWQLWLYFHWVSFSSCLRCGGTLTEACLRGDRQTTRQADRQLGKHTKKDNERGRQRKRTRALRYKDQRWPEVCLFWFPLLLWAGLGLFKGSSHHLFILLWVWRTSRVYHCRNLGNYTQTCVSI